MYELLEFLYREAQLVDINCKIITCKHVNMARKRKTRSQQAYLIDMWKQFEEGDIDSKGLLEMAARFTAF